MPETVERANVLAEEMLRRASSGSDSIRALLETELSGLTPIEKLPILEALEEIFTISLEEEAPVITAPDEASQLISRFLGKNLDADGLEREEIVEKFTLALNTLFDTLNRIMAVINKTLLGEEPELATIRQIIGSNLDGEGNYVSLIQYMERIQKSFLIAHTSFQEASASLLDEILGELDPDRLSKSLSSGLKFGALRKAELFDMYDEKFSKLKSWHESGQYRARLLREFEKRCQQQFK